jgi:rfaE bifunctional protein kinase chain/domain
MTTSEILSAITKLSALVVGDICLDRWCTYDPSTSEPSRETGIPRIGVVETEVTPGAGGTVANNLVALRAGRVAVLGVTGDDGFGFELHRVLEARGILTEFMVKEAGLHTFTYTKLINAATGVEDRPRVDFINTCTLAEAVEQKVLDKLRSAVEDFDVVLVSDQAETSQGGVVTSLVRELLAELGERFPRKIFFVDSRMRVELFRNVIVKANEQEAELACRRLFGIVDFERLRREVAGRLMMVTHGPKGVLLVDESGETWVRTRPVDNPVDICGAGDSFSAASALSLAASGSAPAAARFGNLAASITIMKKGTGTASPEEVLAAEESASR